MKKERKKTGAIAALLLKSAAAKFSNSAQLVPCFWLYVPFLPKKNLLTVWHKQNTEVSAKSLDILSLHFPDTFKQMSFSGRKLGDNPNKSARRRYKS
jgi:hypothetical protein